MSKKSDLKKFLIEIKLKKSCNLSFVDNYISYEGNISRCNLLGYLYFLKYQLANYKIIYKFGEEDFQTYLNKQYPPRKQQVDRIDEGLRDCYSEKAKLSIKEILEFIDIFREK